ncbi:MAG: ribonuclease HII [Minisyncoccia bacterium]
MKIIAGVDEVGRGPLAGPVSVCIVSCEINIYKKLKNSRTLPAHGKDSKKLKPLEREKFQKVLENLTKEKKISYSITHIGNKIIDSRGILFAINKAIFSNIKKLKLNPKNTEVLLDGNLKAPQEFKNQKTIIKGDEKEKIIAWASILAKVSRDTLMSRLSKKFPKYGFELHKGYGTEKHIKMIKKNGQTPIHRKTFLKS